ncbi:MULTISPECIES: hypothetical protein [Rhodopseudomonas]|uniref:Uncharacterized protein n=1 Tax=Rhodopseudomonas palustris TaxID=1076 RepID=A0A0D7EFP7_RHOPL|nr:MULTISPECIES: hypothetical protein [Rhodopseudomonas]KIZ39563.1 hypothetical protein OO17_20035 [Rhodopseudomonas palustris]MDF3810447.1 hypothetical protein [Rhodopseudomonas sp. BAL398]WOK19573.1 hypothetical protein RBJ75_08680 [Rhodopseudomonas sp. BAL398]
MLEALSELRAVFSGYSVHIGGFFLTAVPHTVQQVLMGRFGSDHRTKTSTLAFCRPWFVLLIKVPCHKKRCIALHEAPI